MALIRARRVLSAVKYYNFSAARRLTEGKCTDDDQYMAVQAAKVLYVLIESRNRASAPVFTRPFQLGNDAGLWQRPKERV